MATVGRAICAVTGRHRWDYVRDACTRCKRTGAEIVAGAMSTCRLLEIDSYNRGLEAGAAIADAQTAQAYSNGYVAGYAHGTIENERTAES